MRSLKQQLSKISPLTVSIVLIFAAAMTFIIIRSFAAIGQASLYTSPSGTQSVTQGQTFTTSIRVSTASNVPVTGASVYLSYPSDKLSVQGLSYDGSPYNFEVVQSDSGGTLRMDRAALPVISGGDKLFATITFKAMASGSAAVGFTGNSFVTSGDDDSNLPLQKSGLVYNISAPSSGGSSSASAPSSNKSGSSANANKSSTSSSTQKPTGSTANSTNTNAADNTSSETPGDSPLTAETSMESTNSLLEILVLDENNNPVQGAEVTVNGQTVKTNEQGLAAFEKVPKGKHDLVVNYKGKKTFASAEVKGISTANKPESVTVTVKSDSINPLVWISIPLIGLSAVAAFLFVKTRMNKVKGATVHSGISPSPKDQPKPHAPPKSFTLSTPGSTFSPRPDASRPEDINHQDKPAV